MSRGVTLATGRTRTVVLVALAAFFASLLMTTVSVAQPASVFAVQPSNPGNGNGNGNGNDNSGGTGGGNGGGQETIPGWCNSIHSPTSADGVAISFNASGVEFNSGTLYRDTLSGGYYSNSSDGTYLGQGTVTFTATYGGGEGPWCVSYNGVAVDSGLLPSGAGTYVGTFDIETIRTLAGGKKQGKGRLGGELCVGARLTGGTGNAGAPKGHSCISLAAFTRPGATPPPPGGCTVNCSSNPPVLPPGGGVLAVVTEKPATAPPTDSLVANTSSTVPALGLLLLILAAVLGTIGWFTPATKRIRR